MKKLLVLFLCLVMAASFTACSDDTKSKDDKNGEKQTESAEGKGGSGSVRVDGKSGAFDEEDILNNLSTKAYSFNDTYSHYAILVIKNNSDSDCRLEANIVFKDENGETIGAQTGYASILEKNEETCIHVMNSDAFASFDYTYDVSEVYLEGAKSSVSCETSVVKDKVLCTFTNNGSSEVSVSGQILFMSGEDIVGVSYLFPGNIKAGGSAVEESRFYGSNKSFDDVKVYYEAYASTY